MKPDDRGRFTVMVIPDGGRERRTFHLSRGRLRLLAACASVAALALTAIAGSWWYLAARAGAVPELEARIRELEGERVRVEALVRELADLEGRYEQIRYLFGTPSTAEEGDAWSAPATGSARRSGASVPSEGERTLPSSWPLTVRGVVTQEVTDDGGSEHPGLDIAVATDSYIRAAGAGTVVDVGEDAVYGRYVVVDHGDGYASLYGHASLLLVERGRRVRRNEVIALSGSTGRSTAPHLHFEIVLNGEAIDPLTLVSRP